MSAIWDVTLFNVFQWERREQAEPIRRFRTQKAASLLAYLVLHRDQPPLLREQIIDRFWPDVPVELARHNLSNALTSLRRQIEPPDISADSVLVADRNSVYLRQQAIETDVDRFLTAAVSAENVARERNTLNSKASLLLAQAADLYTGTLLRGFYDEWAIREAERLSYRYLQIIHQMVPLLLAEGEADRALHYARCALATDAYQETTVPLLMQCFAATGQPAQAVQCFRKWEQQLQSEFGAKPPASSYALLDELRVSGKATGKIQTRTAPKPIDSPQPDTPRSGVPPNVAAPANRRENLFGSGFLLTSRTPFFGRQAEMTGLESLLTRPATRLVTVLGAGGVGKTRLALETACRLAAVREETEGGDFSHAVFASLADIQEPNFIPDAILKALALLHKSGDPLTQVVERLNQLSAATPECSRTTSPRLLLLLDNLEQLAGDPATATLILSLLHRCPTLACLVTSRQSLRVDGEHVFPIEPLPLVGVGPETLKARAGHPAIQLFMSRVQAVVPDFQLTPVNSDAVAAVCDRLEGIPLAIELAAARIRTFTPSQMLTQLGEHRFEFLVGRKRNMAARHQTLRDAIAWSYRLLPQEAARFLSYLSVFRGGCTIASARAVCGVHDAETLLGVLLDASLIQSRSSGEDTRFYLLETIREFADSELTDAERARLQEAHDRYFQSVVESVKGFLRGANQVQYLDRLAEEHDNLRAVLHRACRADRAGFGLELAVALGDFFYTRCYFLEGEQWLDTLLALRKADSGSTEDALLEAEALHRTGVMAQSRGDLEKAHRHLQAALTAREKQKDYQGMAATLNTLGNVLYFRGDHDEAIALYNRALGIAREHGFPREAAAVLNNLGNHAVNHSDLEGAREAFEECLGIRREMGDLAKVAITLSNIGNLAVEQKDYTAAESYYTEALALHQQMRNTGGIARVLGNRGRLYYYQRRFTDSLACFRDALHILASLDLNHVIIAFLEYAACTLISVDQAKTAARFLGTAAALRSEKGIHPGGEGREMIGQAKQAIIDTLGDAGFDRNFQAGCRAPWQEAEAKLEDILAMK